MKLKTLKIGDNLRESIPENQQPALPQICRDNFDEYLDRQWECHWHPEIEVGIVNSGTVEFTVYGENEQTSFVLEKGDGIFINAGVLHSAISSVQDSVISETVFTPNLFDGCLFGGVFCKNVRTIISNGLKCITFSHKTASDGELLDGISKLCRTQKNEQGYELFIVESLCRVCRLLLKMMQGNFRRAWSENVSEIRAKRMLSYLQAHFSEKITVDDLAKIINVSRTECFRTFKSVIGKTPVEYLVQYRLQTACTLLYAETCTISQISLLCGFQNQSYFGKMFKERFGVSPKKYRDQTRTHLNYGEKIELLR